MISTKGRYSIRVLLDLAEHRSGEKAFSNNSLSCILRHLR